MPAFPISPVGKILKRQLRDMIVSKLEAERVRRAIQPDAS